jgi:cytochrome P450
MSISQSDDQRVDTGPRHPTDELFGSFDNFTTLSLDEDPVPRLREMRESCPIGWSEQQGGNWILTHYEDIWNAARNPGLFSSAHGVSLPAHGMPPLPPIETDPPLHTIIRGALISHFSPGAMAKRQPHAREVVTALIDAFIEDGHADLAGQLTMPLPAIVNTPVLGIPTEDCETFPAWAVALLSSGGEDLEAIGSCMGYFDKMYGDRNRKPRDDMPTILTNIEIDGQPMDKTQFILAMIMIMSGGLDTTTNSGALMLDYLAAHPYQRQQLIDDPSLIPSAIEELLRHLTPLPALFRTATADTAIHGRDIVEGEKVQLCWMAANHDPAEFPDPESIDLTRSPNRHLSFGVGVHRCLGAALARMELKVLLEEALPRLGDYRVVEPITRYASITRGVGKLLVSFPPGKRRGASDSA